MKKFSGYAAILVLTAVLLCSCKGEENNKISSMLKPQNSVTESVSPNTSASSESPPAASSVTVRTEYGKPAALPAAEPAKTELMYVTRQKYAKTQPRADAERAAFYNAGEAVYVTGKTENGYMELCGGGYISCSYIRKTCEPFQPKEVCDNKFGKAPAAFTRRNGIYNSQAALDYAALHWRETSSLCAEFVSECITAGGLKYDIASATELYNALILNKNGTPFEVEVNADGTVNIPKFAQSGDIIFYYCEKENLMVHAAIYSARTPSGKALAYAHNPVNDANEPLTYKQYCPGDCGYPLERAVLVCLDGIFFE